MDLDDFISSLESDDMVSIFINHYSLSGSTIIQHLSMYIHLFNKARKIKSLTQKASLNTL